MRLRIAKILMGLKKKNEEIELIDDFILEKEGTKYPNLNRYY